MWAVAMVAEHAAIYSASEVDMATGVGIVVCFNECSIVEDHIANGGAASIRTVLPTGIRENCEVSIGNAVL